MTEDDEGKEQAKGEGPTCFASDRGGGPGSEDSTDWRSPGDGLSVSPDDILNEWAPPQTQTPQEVRGELPRSAAKRSCETNRDGKSACGNARARRVQPLCHR
jgi:hypothetical protein